MDEIVPEARDKRKLRACLLCSLVKSFAQFQSAGCDNCEALFELKGNPDGISDCTTASFDGLIAMMQPEKSWVSRWQRVDKFKPGMYAMRIAGRLPENIIEDLEAKGIKYRPRDGSIMD